MQRSKLALTPRTWTFALALLTLTIVTYWPTHAFDFVEYDDPDYVFRNNVVKDGITWWGLTWAFVDAHACNWHPLTWLSHMLDCQLFGLNAGAHHTVNVTLHSINAVLLFLVLNAATGSRWKSVFVAAAFAIHPLRVESVAWISERKDVLSATFFFLALLAYIQHTNGTAKRWYRLSLGCFALGLLAKPMIVTLPCVMLLLDVWPLKRIPLSTLGLHNMKPMVLEKVPFFLLSLALSIITYFAQRKGAVITLADHGISARLATVVTGYLTYLKQIICPADLTWLYLRPHQPLEQIVIALLTLGVITFLAVRTLRQMPYIAVGWFWYLGILFPVSGIMQTGLQATADRYTYLPAIGLLISLTWLIEDTLSDTKNQGPMPTRLKTACASLAVGLLCAWSIATRQQMQIWKNTETLMTHAIRLNPNNYVAHQNLALYLTSTGRSEEAKSHREKVRQFAPEIAKVHKTQQ